MKCEEFINATLKYQGQYWRSGRALRSYFIPGTDWAEEQQLLRLVPIHIFMDAILGSVFELS